MGFWWLDAFFLGDVLRVFYGTNSTDKLTTIKKSKRAFKLHSIQNICQKSSKTKEKLQIESKSCYEGCLVSFRWL